MAGVPGSRMEWRRACAGRMRAAVGGATMRGQGRRSRFPVGVARRPRRPGALPVPELGSERRGPPRVRAGVSGAARRGFSQPGKSRPKRAAAPHVRLHVGGPRPPPPAPGPRPSRGPTVDQARCPSPAHGPAHGGEARAARRRSRRPEVSRRSRPWGPAPARGEPAARRGGGAGRRAGAGRREPSGPGVPRRRARRVAAFLPHATGVRAKWAGGP
ncbi:translation initiation factor IF-2-like [Mustela erminea]|uniref:translation initiation factor IF-2-like n=1 Tax=Mustela erminea TaxID=36723 RepID=UPI001386F3DC|nr:translation initiation factor IF-2-like [Mustela erminea]